MKKAVKIVICAVLAVIIAAGCITYALLPHPLNYDIESITPVGTDVSISKQEDDSVTIRKNGDGDFKILMFTDMHLDGKNKTSKITVDHLVKNIQREKPDLVLLGGDNVTSGINRKRSNQLAQIFEKLDVYWGGVLGNHEGDNSYSISREEMVDIFSSYPHCLMRKGLDSADGNCNYSINILNSDGTLKETFFFLDTFDELTDEQIKEFGVDPEKSTYDGAHENQIEWYTQKVEQTRLMYGDFESILLMHIPLPQVAQLAETGNFKYGVNLEGVCQSAVDRGLFDAVKSSGTTKTVFCGHDHLNTFGGDYQGILLSYIEPSGYGAYGAAKLGYEEKDWLQGYTVLEIKDDGTFTQTQVRNSTIEE
ncbi:MAG: metallophosphoesterase [Clostridia bacterium]|nr:metallophosphoesterase [Clostridia bacterium]